jgi:hypothetical protein
MTFTFNQLVRLLALLLACWSGTTSAQSPLYLPSPMILQLQTMQNGIQVCIPFGSQTAANLTIDWGDGTALQPWTSLVSCGFGDLTFGPSHTYAAANVHVVSVWDTSSDPTLVLKHFGFSGPADYSAPGGWYLASNVRLLSVLSWGNLQLSSLQWAFRATQYLSSLPVDLPATVVSLLGAFAESTFNNASVSLWDVSRVQDIQDVFFRNPVFNRPLNTWDVSSVTNMRGALSECPFNHALASWNVSKVTNMLGMFRGNTAFSQTLSSWDVSHVLSMQEMFADATNFNDDLSSWPVHCVRTWDRFSQNAAIFSQSIPPFGTSYSQCTINPLQIRVDVTSAQAAVCVPFGNQLSVQLGVYWGDSSHYETHKVAVSCALGDSTMGLKHIFNFTGSFNIFVWDFGAATDSTAIRQIGFDVTDNYAVAIGWSQFPGIRLVCFLQWGDTFAPISLAWAFRRASFLSCLPLNIPSTVRSLHGTFSESNFSNGSIAAWDTSRVEDMQDLFFRNSAFNRPLASWTVSSVANFRGTFSESPFNQPLDNWDVSQATSMYGMFRANTVFNQPLPSWNVFKVVFMQFMFLDSSSFNQNLSNWCVGSVINYDQFAGGSNRLSASLWPRFGAQPPTCSPPPAASSPTRVPTVPAPMTAPTAFPIGSAPPIKVPAAAPMVSSAPGPVQRISGALVLLALFVCLL